MKICEKCGAYNSDNRKFCVDCGDTLGDKLSAVQEQQIQQNIDAQLETMYNKKDPLYVSRFDKILGVVSLVGLVVSLVLLVVRLILRQSAQGLFFGIILFLLSAVEALLPQISWEFEKWCLSFRINGTEDIEPGDFYCTGRRYTCAILVLVGLTMLISNFF